MEARRRVELTSTNCSIGLIYEASCAVVNVPLPNEDFGSNTAKYLKWYDMLVFAPLPVSADPVVMAGVPHPIPFRTRSLSPLALMVLRF